ncbi:MAG: hypothetical protein AAF754_19800, partial [Pseudomonadota bacterium]
MTLSLPHTFTDGAGFTWDIQSDGRIRNGSADAFDAGMDLVDLRTVSSAGIDMDGRQLTLSAGPAVSNSNVSLERRIYVPDDEPWARFIDTATNTSGMPQTFTFRLSTKFGSDSLTRVVATSSGDQTLDASDHYFINDDDNPAGNDPQVAIAFGDGTLAATSAAYTSTDIAEMSFTV